MKNLFCCMILLFTFSLNVNAANVNNNIVKQTQTSLTSEIKKMEAKVKPAAIWVFWTFALIEMIIVFGFMLLRQEIEIGPIFANLVRLILIFGLFFWFFQNTAVLKTIFDSFQQLGTAATPNSNINLDSIIEQIGKMWENVSNSLSAFNIGNSILLIVLASFATIALVLLIAKALTIYMFFLFSLYVGVIFFAFASLQYTRQWAINAITNIIRSGAKFMMVILVMGIMINFINTAVQNATQDTGSLLYLFIMSFLTWSFIMGIDAWVDSYFTGLGGGENNAGIQLAHSMMLGAGMGAVGGALGGYSAVKEAASVNQNNSSNKFSSFMKAASAAALGAGAGATSGAIKGGLGFNTLNAGQKSGSGIVNSIKSVNSIGKPANSNLDKNGFNLDNLNSSDKKVLHQVEQFQKIKENNES